MALSSTSLESTFDEFLEALQTGSRGSPAVSPFRSALASARAEKASAPQRGSPMQSDPDRSHTPSSPGQRSFSVWDSDSPQVSRRSFGAVRLDFDPVEKLRDLTAIVNQQQSTISALQTRIETGLQSLGADLRDALRDTATQKRLTEVENEMQQWSRRRTEGDAERSMRLDAVADRCQHALVSTSRHESQLLEIERRLGALEAELPQQAKRQRSSEQQLEAQARSLLDRVNSIGAKVASAQDAHTQEAALIAEWHRIHAAKLSEHEMALGDLRGSVRHGESISSDHAGRLEAVASKCEGVVNEADRSRLAAERVMHGLAAEVGKLRSRVELDGARSNAAAALTNTVTKLTADLADAIRSARASAAENCEAAALVMSAGGKQPAERSSAASGTLIALASSGPGISAADGAARFASKGMSMHSALLAEEAGGGAADLLSNNRASDLDKYREASARAIAQSEKLAASLEGSVADAADVTSAVETLQKEEELVKLKEGMHDAMVRSVGEQCELAVAAAMTTFEEARLAPKLTGMTNDLRQSLAENAATVDRTAESLREKILAVQSSGKESSVAIEGKLLEMESAAKEQGVRARKLEDTVAAAQTKLATVESTLQAGKQDVEALQSLTAKQISRMDSDIAMLLDIIADLEKGGGAIMKQVTVKIKEVVDMIMAEQKEAAVRSAKEMEQAKLEAETALKEEAERLRKETIDRKKAEKERAQQSQLASMKTKAAAEKAREKCLVEGWVAIEAFTVTGEKRRDAKRKVCWMELTPGLLSLHDQFLGHASSRLPVLGADVRVVEKQEKKPGTGVFSSEKIPVWLLTVDFSTDSVARARGVHYECLVLCFMGEEQRTMFSGWDNLLRKQASAGGVDIEDEIRYRDDIKARRQATEVMATKPLPTLTPVQWGWVNVELHVKKKKEWALPSMQWVTVFQSQPDAGYGAKAAGGGSRSKLVLGVGAWQIVEPHRYLLTLSGGASLDLPKSSRKLTNGMPAKYAIKVSISEADRSKCIQDEKALLQVSSKAMNARPKSTATEEDQDAEGPQEDKIEVGEPLEKIVMLFAAEREGKRWMDLLSGPGGAKLELNKKAEKSMGSMYNIPTGDATEGVGIEMNEAAKRMVAAETIQRRWRAKKARAAVESGTTLPDGNVEASTAGRPVGLGAASSSDRPRDEQMPPGLTKMQQMAWKRTREKEQQAQ